MTAIRSEQDFRGVQNNSSAARILVLALLVLILPTKYIGAADFRLINTPGSDLPSRILIEGEIEPGDYREFFKSVMISDPWVDTVEIFSPGGDVLEAMRIGRAIRKLRLKTEVPISADAKAVEFYGNIRSVAPENVTCASACFYIFVAGIHRFGDVLGVHRPYVYHEHLRSMSASEAEDAFEVIRRESDAYLRTMGVPQSIVETLNSAGSHEIYWINRTEKDRYFSGLIPEYQEWVNARCGRWNEDYEEGTRLARRKADGTATAEELAQLDRILERESTMLSCTLELERQLRDEARAKCRFSWDDIYQPVVCE